MGEPAHKHGMAKPRRSLGLINLTATTTGPIRSGPYGSRPWVAAGPVPSTCPSDPRMGVSRVLEIQTDDRGDHVVCRPVGELDAYTVSTFRDSLSALSTRPRVVIDLSDVPFMDSAGLGALIGGIRRTRENGGEVAVACSRPTLTRLLHTTGFDRIVSVTETVDEAVVAVGHPS